MVLPEQPHPVDRQGPDVETPELVEGPGPVVEGGEHGCPREGLGEREHHPFRPTPLGEVVVDQRDGHGPGPRGVGMRRHDGLPPGSA